jgi:photosystem II stability/assembly factor-like uncharacterized protein
MKTFLRTLFFFLLVTQMCFAQWYQQNMGTEAYLYGVQFIDPDNGWAVGSGGTILKTSNGGTDWTTLNSGITEVLQALCFTDANNGVVCGWNGTILRTSNGGVSWISITSGITLNLFDICFSDGNTGWIVGENGTVLKTSNSGIDWIPQSVGITGTLYDIDFIDSNTGWITGEEMLKTTNGGTDWIPLPNGMYKIDFVDYNKGWAVSDNMIFCSTDGGTNWISQISDTLSQCWLNDICFLDMNYGWVVGGWQKDFIEYGWILNTKDGGIIWDINYKSGPYVGSGELSGLFFNNALTGWAVGSSILHTTNGGVTFINEEQIDEVPTQYLLLQNYPNPFNSSSVIKYSIPKSSQVSLKIFNTLGEELETLVNEEKAAGTYELNWNAANLPSGVYFYRLQAGSFVQTRKMILLK